MTLLAEGEEFAIHHGDCIQHMAEMPESCVDHSVFSPPFASLYAYTDLETDMGNVDEIGAEAILHLRWFYRQILRVMKPGRVMIVHVAQVPRFKRTGGSGLCDFRGINIRLGQRAGFIYEYDWLIPKPPQAQAIRTKSRSLQFSGLETDRAVSRGALGDYLIKFVKPGENKVPIDSDGQVSRNQWIDWAESAWFGIRVTDTLNVAEGRSEKDVKHICPLQLEVIERSVRLFSNPGELIFSPFVGIGSELVTALKLERFGYGCEIKPEYIAAAIRNCRRAVEARTKQASLFSAG
jgi:DNA modification methylase